MTKEDYMKLSKERLAELLEERDNGPVHIYLPPENNWSPKCYEPNGTCTNPYIDCINCPKKWAGGGYTISSTSSTNQFPKK